MSQAPDRATGDSSRLSPARNEPVRLDVRAFSCPNGERLVFRGWETPFCCTRPNIYKYVLIIRGIYKLIKVTGSGIIPPLPPPLRQTFFPRWRCVHLSFWLSVTIYKTRRVPFFTCHTTMKTALLNIITLHRRKSARNPQIVRLDVTFN